MARPPREKPGVAATASLVGAIAFHAAVAWGMARVRETPRVVPPEVPHASPVEIELVESRELASIATPPSTPLSSAAAEPAIGVVVAPHASAAHVVEVLHAKADTTSSPIGPSASPPGVSDAPLVTSAASAAPSDAFSNLGPTKKPWMPGKIGDGATLGELPPEDASTKAALAAKKLDQEIATLSDKGLGAKTAYAGPAVGAAYEAARSSIAPETGVAVFVVTTDASGSVTGVSLGDVTSDSPGWNAVGKTLQAKLAGKKLEVPSGASGVAITMRVEAKHALPSGSTSALSDPGVKGTGAGATFGFKFDLSDIGQKLTRQVSVVVTNEARL